jgi:hypothetical protein
MKKKSKLLFPKIAENIFDTQFEHQKIWKSLNIIFKNIYKS